MRLFLAVVPPAPIRREVALVVQGFAGRRGGRFVVENNLHLSLKFLGETPDSLVPRIQAATDACLHRAPFELHWGQLGAFPNLARARVAYLGVRSDGDELPMLARDLTESLRRELPGKKELNDGRAFRGHLTLARFKQPPPAPYLEELRSELAPLSWRSTLSSVVLVRSVLSPEGARYAALSEHSLRP